MAVIERLILKLSSLKVAIFLLIIIAICSSIGTAIPQGESPQIIIDKYNLNPWLGYINGETLLFLKLDHIYSSFWFIGLLIWLGFALMACSWRRQIPILKSALKWIDYKSEKQIDKLLVSEKINVSDNPSIIDELSIHLKNTGWEINKKNKRIAARRGVIGRVGPLLVHIGLILLMIGSIVGVLSGEKVERFILPGRSIKLIDQSGDNQLKIKLKDFKIIRNSNGNPEQFISSLIISQPNRDEMYQETRVNHPLRIRGLTIYQADWALSALTVQLNNSPKLRFPLNRIEELGDEIYGVLIPTDPENTNYVLLTLSNENGPVKIFNNEGKLLGSASIGEEFNEIDNVSIKITDVLKSSGLLIKRDPGVPLVYSGFAVTLIGGILSIIATKKIWILLDEEEKILYIGGESNRNPYGLYLDLPKLTKVITNL